MYKVLIIQLTRMGDIIQTLPLLTRLHEKYEKLQITFFCVSEFAEVIRYTPLIHRYIKIPAGTATLLRKNEDLNVLREILAHPYLKERYDLVVNLTHDFPSGYIAHRIVSDLKSGLVCPDQNQAFIPDRWGRYLFSLVRNRLDNSFNLVDIHVGMGHVRQKPVANYLTIPMRVLKKASLWLEKMGILNGKRLIIFHLGASRLHRAWPLEYFVELGRLLVKDGDAVVILTGHGDKEEQMADLFVRYWQNTNCSTGTLLNLVGKLTVHNLVALISRASLFVSSDTGPIHIAAALGIPTLGIYVATAYPGETAPYGKGHVVITPEMDCYPCMDVSVGKECSLQCRNKIVPEIVSLLASRILRGEGIGSVDEPGIEVRHSTFLTNGTLVYLPTGKVRNKNFARQIVHRYLWDFVFGMDSDPNLKRLVDHDVLTIEATKILDEIAREKAKLLTIQRRILSYGWNGAFDDLAVVLFDLFRRGDKAKGIVRDYFSLVPPCYVHSYGDILGLLNKGLVDIENALYGIKSLLQ